MAKILTTDAIAPIKGYIDGKVGDLAEIVEGKCNTYVLSYSDTISAIESFIETEEYESDFICDAEGNDITSSISDYESVSVMNSGFNTNLASIGTQTDQYIILRNVPTTLPQASGRFEYVLAKLSELNLKIGDVFLIIETDVPDRWFAKDGDVSRFYKMETAKVDLSDVVKLAGAQTITGAKTFDSEIKLNDSIKFSPTSTYYGNIIVESQGIKIGTNVQDMVAFSGYGFYAMTNFQPNADNSYDLGQSSNKWKDLYLSDGINIGTTSTIKNDSWGTLVLSCSNGEVKFNHKITPVGNSTDIGSTTYKWKDLYLSGDINIGSGKIWYNGSLFVNDDFSPSNSSISLGKTSYPWKDIYLGGAINLGNFGLYPSDANEIRLRKASADFLRIQNNLIMPYTDNNLDLGNGTHKFKDLYLNGELKVGEYGSKIKEDNGALFLQGSSGVIKADNTLRPTSNNAKDLGETNYYWKEAFVKKLRFDDWTWIGQTNSDLYMESITGYVRFNAHLRPSGDNSKDIGTSSMKWKDLYMGGSIVFDTDTKIERNANNNQLLFYAGHSNPAMQITDSRIYFRKSIRPYYNSVDIGGTGELWHDLYLNGNITDGTNSVSVANLPSKATTAVGQYTFADGVFIMPKSLLTQGLYVFTYGNCSAFVLIMDTMWAYAHQSPIRTAMPVIYDTSGNCRPGTLGLYRTDSNGDPNASGDYVTVALFDSQGNPVENDYQMTIIRTGML